MPSLIDWERLGQTSGQAAAEGSGAYYDPATGATVNGLDTEERRARGDELAPVIIRALQPGRADDAQFHADCQRFADGFAHGYTLALI